MCTPVTYAGIDQLVWFRFNLLHFPVQKMIGVYHVALTAIEEGKIARRDFDRI